MNMIEHGYPTDDALELLRTWDWKKGWTNLMSLVQSIWHWGDNQYSTRTLDDDLGRVEVEYTFHTGGWSGNEDIIDALQSNFMFWMMCWYQSRRGGHYKFRVRLSSDNPKKCDEAALDAYARGDN